jgi:hypothetical protein
MTYEEHEATALQTLSGTQGERINARLQAAFNYAIACELAMGEVFDLSEVADGIVNGVCGMLGMVHNNIAAADDIETANALTPQILTSLVRTWTKNQKQYLESLVYVGSVTSNPHKGGRA